MESDRKWYNNSHLVGYLLIFLMPLGLYGLYKSETIDKKWKNAVTISAFMALLLLVVDCFW